MTVLLLPELPAQSKATNVQQNPTAKWTDSRVSPKLTVNIKDDVKKVHFVETNNDPYVYTKTYELKNANPYSTRNYLISAVQALRVNDNDTRVECIKYNDGTGLVLVSAEGYRFNEKQNGGMTIDELVVSLDMPELKSLTGKLRFMYFPKYISASSLKTMIDRVGINPNTDSSGTQFSANSNEQEIGLDVTEIDNGLNALFLYISDYNLKTAIDRLKIYDVPAPEARIRATVYEIYDENDGKIGADFQSWKNGPGADFFNVGGRWRHGINPDGMIPDASKWSSTKYVKFSPKWNSKYLDFLAAEGKGRIISSGEINVKNKITGTITAKTQIPYFDTSTSVGKGGFITQYDIINGFFSQAGANPTTIPVAAATNYMVNAYDTQGTAVTISNYFAGRLIISQFGIEKGADAKTTTGYTMTLPDKKAYFVKDGKNMGYTVDVASLDISKIAIVSTINVSWEPYVPVWKADYNGTYDRGPQVKSAFADLNFSNNEYGFQMVVTPVITQKATTLQLKLANTSLIGFQSNGAVRTSKSYLSTEVMLDNDSGEIIIGGIEKKSIERGVTKVPWLGSIPGLGWLFASEYENSKKSQIITVLECYTVRPDTKVEAKTAEALSSIKTATENAGKNDLEDPNYGFNQFLLDKDVKGLEPLP